MKIVWVLLASPFLAAQGMAADIAAGHVEAAAVCAACHGENGISVADHIPHLAGQRAAYIEAQLEAFRDGSRKNELMGVIAPQLTASDSADLAAYFQSLPGAPVSAKSELMPSIAKTRVTLPASFATGYRRYWVNELPENRQIKYYYASPATLAAAAAGRALPEDAAVYIEVYSVKLGADTKPALSADGKLQPDQLKSFVAMATGKAWGDPIPDMLRNGNWNYALFNADRSLRTGMNYAECLACHKAQKANNYLFSYQEMKAAGH